MARSDNPKSRRRGAFAGGAAVLVLLGGAFALTGGTGGYLGHHAAMHGHGADGAGHDMVNMPGLRGANTSAAETAEMAMMFRRFDTLTREVTNLPDGIRTVTGSSDADVMAALVSHVTVMIDRVERGDDPQVIIQSPTLDLFFARGEDIETTIDLTEDGIVVVQTATDPQLVEALHLHAAEVTAMVDRGMDAVHDRMMAGQ